MKQNFLSRIPMFFAALLFSVTTFAQDMEIKGRVIDSNGEALYGVNVAVKGTSRGGITNDKGSYTVKASKGSTLVFSYIGFVTREATVGSANTIDITLQAGDDILNEVVVTALGIKKEKKALGYSVSEVKGDELTKSRTTNIANNLVGRVAGLNVAAPASGAGGSSRITIRGNGSISGNNQPLIVVDGIPINNDNLGNAGMWGGNDRGDGISSLNPDEIESMSVLKGATAAALYGSRASNGAILVTTKGGKKGKGIGLEVNSNMVVEDLLIKEWTDYQYEYGLGNRGLKPTTVQETITGNSWGAKLDGSPTIQFDGQQRPYSAVRNNLTNFYRTGRTLNNSVALSGATENVTYRLSMNNLTNQDIIPNSGLDRNNLALNVNGNLGSRISFVSNVKYVTERTKNRARMSDSPGSPTYAMFMLPTSLDVNVLKEQKYDANRYERIWNDNIYVTNPWYAAEDWLNSDKKNRIMATFEPRVNITDWLYVKGRIGADFFNYRYQGIEPYGVPFKIRGSYNVNERTFNEQNTDLMIGAEKKLTSKIGVNALFGGNMMRQVTTINNFGGNNLNIPFFYDITNIDPANRGANEAYIEKRINALYGSVEVAYNNYLFVTATARNDWFSTLAPGNNSILYPSIGASFVASDAFKLPTFVNLLKFRGSWAQAGGDTDPYALSLYYRLSGAHLGAPLSEINGGRVPNAGLQPLTSTTLELGLDTRLFNNRVGLDLAVYNRKTTNDIVGATISQTSGYGNALFNVGEMNNKGIEMLLTVEPVKTKSLTWETGLNFGYNINEVVNLYGKLTQIRVDENRTRTAYINHVIGLPYSQVQGFDYKRDANGNIVNDAQGFPVQGALKNFGSGVAPLTLGWTNSVSFKAFTLNALIDGKFGGVMFAGSQSYAQRRGLTSNTLEGRDGTYVGPGVNDKGEPNRVQLNRQDYEGRLASNIATPWVYDADFIKLRTLSLDYAVPTKALGKSPFKGASIALVGRNLAILMKKVPNIDPESLYNNSNAQGLELAGVPPTRSLGMNLNLKF